MMVHHESSLYNVFKFEQDWIILLLKEGCPITLLYSDLIETGHTVLQGLLEYGAVKPDTPIFRKVQGSNSANLSREQISVSRKPRRTKHATDGPMLVNESPKKYVLNLKYVF